MPHKTLDIAGSTIAWAVALSATCLALVALWFSRHQHILQPDSPINQGFRREFLDTMKKIRQHFFISIISSALRVETA